MTTIYAPIEVPQWFGDPERPLFGWVTAPATGRSRGAVLLAPPVAREAHAPRRALRELAVELARRGVASLRFDYDGTGDSAGGFGDPGRGDAWVHSAALGAAHLRSLGATSLSGVGVRLGATILGAAADTEDVDFDALVLWDPVDSGRSFLRQLRALEALRRDISDEGDGSVETAEYVFPAASVSEIGAISLLKGEGPLAGEVLCLTREGRDVSDRLRERLELGKVEFEESPDLAAMMDVTPLEAVMPRATIRRLAAWLAGQAPPAADFEVPEPSAPATMTDPVTGVRVVERFERLGSRGLFGIVTEPEGAGDAPLVAMSNVANEEHIGPSRQWVELSRRWAARGLRCVRFDMTGLGDSPQAVGRALRGRYDATYEQVWLDDVPEVVSELAAKDPSNSILVGLCSGGYFAMETALRLHSKAAIVINPPVGMDLLAGASILGSAGTPGKLRVADALREVALRLRWVSAGAWFLFRFLMPRYFRRELMPTLGAQGTEVCVLASAHDVVLWPRFPQLGNTLARTLTKPKNYEVQFVQDLDHSMHVAVGRDRALAELFRKVDDLSPAAGSDAGTLSGS